MKFKKFNMKLSYCIIHFYITISSLLGVYSASSEILENCKENHVVIVKINATIILATAEDYRLRIHRDITAITIKDVDDERDSNLNIRIPVYDKEKISLKIRDSREVKIVAYPNKNKHLPIFLYGPRKFSKSKYDMKIVACPNNVQTCTCDVFGKYCSIVSITDNEFKDVCADMSIFPATVFHRQTYSPPATVSHRQTYSPPATVSHRQTYSPPATVFHRQPYSPPATVFDRQTFSPPATVSDRQTYSPPVYKFNTSTEDIFIYDVTTTKSVIDANLSHVNQNYSQQNYTQLSTTSEPKQNSNETVTLLLCFSGILILGLFITIIILQRKMYKLKNEDFTMQTLTNHEVVSALLGPISTLSSRRNDSINMNDTILFKPEPVCDVSVQAPSLKSPCPSQSMETESLASNFIPPIYMSTPDVGNFVLDSKIKIRQNFSFSSPDLVRVDDESETIVPSKEILENYFIRHAHHFWSVAQSNISLADNEHYYCDPVCLDQQKKNMEHLNVKEYTVSATELIEKAKLNDVNVIEVYDNDDTIHESHDNDGPI